MVATIILYFEKICRLFYILLFLTKFDGNVVNSIDNAHVMLKNWTWTFRHLGVWWTVAIPSFFSNPHQFWLGTHLCCRKNAKWQESKMAVQQDWGCLGSKDRSIYIWQRCVVSMFVVNIKYRPVATKTANRRCPCKPTCLNFLRKLLFYGN